MEDMIFIPWLVSSFLIFFELIVGGFPAFSKIKRNGIIGVRIKYAFSSDEAWNFANRLSGLVLFIIGICEAIIIYPIYATFLNSHFVLVSLCVSFSQAIILIMAIIALVIVFKIKEKKENI